MAKLTDSKLLFILVSAILGSSLFYLPGLGVISSGSASLLAWALVFVFGFFASLYLGELLTTYPTSGGTYTYCHRAYGRFGAFFAGWTIWLAGNLGMALGVVAAAEYFIPEQTTAAFYLRLFFVLLWVIVLQFMAYRGVDAGTTMLTAFGVLATLTVMLMTIPSFIDVPALFGGVFQTSFDFSLLTPFFRHEGSNIVSYLGLSFLLVSEAFFGFEVLSYLSNEAEKPRRLHKVLFKGILLCGVIMTLYVFSSLGTVAYTDYVNNARPFAVQAFNTMGTIGENIVVFGMYLVIIGAAAAWPITGSRLLQAMAKDKLFLEHLAVAHKKHHSPYRAVIFQTIVTVLFSLLVFRGYLAQWGNSYRTFYLLYVLLSFVALALVLFAVPILRKKDAHVERVFRAPLPLLGPFFFLTLFVGLIVNWVFIEGGIAVAIIQIALSFLLLAIPFYFLVEMLYNQKAIVGVNELLSYVVSFGEQFFFPISLRAKMLKTLGNIQGKRILEYGCSVGTLTKRLAQNVLPQGKVIATDFSLHKAAVTRDKTHHHTHVQVHHHPSLEYFHVVLDEPVDIVISIGMLSYMQNPETILQDLADHMKQGAKIFFVDYDKFFYMIPNVRWIEDDHHLKRIFHDAGFEVVVKRKNGLLWQTIIIGGVKR